MNKIIKELLKTKFPNVNIHSLMEVIESTPNIGIATELLCDLYEDPIIPFYCVLNSKGIQLTFDYYDKWRDQVHYTYLKEETKGGYFPKGTDISTVNMDNFDDLKVPYSSSSEYLYIPTGETFTEKSWDSLDTWLKFKRA